MATIAPVYSLLLDNQPPQNQPDTITMDPITRIEGHLRIDVSMDGGTVSDAWSSATLFRGIEMILKGRDPRDAPIITQRLCGVCTYVHLQCAVTAIEDAMGLTIPQNAQLVRNLLHGAQFIHDHPVHFYHLHALDWVDVTLALQASASATDQLANQLSPNAPAMDFAAVKERLTSLVNSGQLGPFSEGYWGHPAHNLSPEANLLLVAHYLEALKQQARTAQLMAIFGGKNPHPHAVVPGGVTCAGELSIQARIDSFSQLLDETNHFIETVYLPDVAFLAQAYPEWASLGGFDNMLAYGEFPLDQYGSGNCLLPGGVIMDRNVMAVQDVDYQAITEDVARSWYEGGDALHPSQGETMPAYSGYNQEDCYSWLKAPRYYGQPMEVGPLARVLVAYGRGDQTVTAAVDGLLSSLNLNLDAMFSVIGRTAARAIETQVIGQAMVGWLSDLQANIAGGTTQVFTRNQVPAGATGVGLGEAPRGALGHWLRTDNLAAIEEYQLVVPSAWNFGPRDGQGQASPVEQALKGLPIADSNRPLEILRLVHSFDPCIACGVHFIDKQGRSKNMVKIL